MPQARANSGEFEWAAAATAAIPLGENPNHTYSAEQRPKRVERQFDVLSTFTAIYPHSVFAVTGPVDAPQHSPVAPQHSRNQVNHI